MINKVKLLKNEFIFLFILISHIPLFIYFYTLNKNGGDKWLTADWLINYKFGIIRRGFFGNLLDVLNIETEKNLIFITLILSFFYILIIFFTYILFKVYSQNLISYFLLFSPQFLFFPVLDWRGAFRKEIFGIFVYLLLIIFKDKLIAKKFRTIFLISYLIAILISEVNILFLPFIYFILYNQFPKNESNKYFKNYIVITFCYVLMVLINISSFSQTTDNICDDLIQEGYNNQICDGSISFLKLNTKETLKFAIDDFKITKLLTYSLFLIISLIPLFFDKYWISLNWKMVFLCLCFFIPFYLISIDWGRWNYIFISGLTFYYFTFENKFKISINRNSILIFLFYISTWRVNHYNSKLIDLIKNISELNIVKVLSNLFELI